MANPLGVLLANVLAPQLVKEPSHVLYLNIIVAVPAVIVALLATAGVNRSEPKTPPTLSAATEQMKFLEGMFFDFMPRLLRVLRYEDMFHKQAIHHFVGRYGRWNWNV